MGAVLFEQSTHINSNMLFLLKLLVWICFRDDVFSTSFYTAVTMGSSHLGCNHFRTGFQ